MASITIPKNDKGFDLSFTINDSTGTAVVLTNYTIKLKVWIIARAGALLLNGTVNIVDANAGTCRYPVVDGDFNAVGKYRAELELTKTNVVESTESFEIIVAESG